MRSLRFRGWLGVLLLLLVIVLTSANLYLWQFYPHSLSLEHQLEESQKTIQEQNTHIVSIAGKLRDLESDLRRIQQFDAKLRVMMNVDIGAGESASSSDEKSDMALQAPGFLPMHRQDLLARQMHSLADQLTEDVGLEEVQQQELMHNLRENREFLSMTPSIWPAEGFLSSPFGLRASPFTNQPRMHTGIDISNRPGTPVIAPGKGTVTFTGWDGAYGNSIQISHGNNISTRYAHLQKAVVKEGQVVSRGDLIGHLGNSGRSTGPHLHYEVRIGGVAVNPMRYILN